MRQTIQLPFVAIALVVGAIGGHRAFAPRSSSSRPPNMAAVRMESLFDGLNERAVAKAEIDAINALLAPLTSFVLPGGTKAAAHLHVARTLARRAERDITALAAEQPVNAAAIRYINRLSDHLFVLGRQVNDDGQKAVLWVPGANR